MIRLLNRALTGSFLQHWATLALMTAVLGVSGCAKKPKQEAAKAEAVAAAPSLSPAEKRAEEQKVVEELAVALKTQEDFEEAAEAEITEKTVDSELEKLGAEITNDPDVAAAAPPVNSAVPAAAATPAK